MRKYSPLRSQSPQSRQTFNQNYCQNLISEYQQTRQEISPLRKTSPLRSPQRNFSTFSHGHTQQSPHLTNYRSSLDYRALILQEFIAELLRLYAKLEELKVEAAEEHRFNLHEIFRFFDKDARGEIYVRDIRKGLDELGQEFRNFDEQDLRLLVKGLERERKGCLTFQEFAKIFEPLDQELTEIVHNRKPKFDLSKGFSEAMFMYRVKKVLVALLIESLITERALTQLKMNLQKTMLNEGISYRQLFGHLAGGHMNLEDQIPLKQETLDEYLQSAKFEKDSDFNQASLLMRLLDQDRDGLLSFDDFFYFMSN